MQNDEMTTAVGVREQLRRVFEEGAAVLVPNPAPQLPENDDQPRMRRPTIVIWTDHHEEAAFEAARVASIATAEEEHRRRDLEHWDTTGIMAPDVFHPFPIPFPMPMGLRAIFTTAAAPRAAHLRGGEWATQLVPAHPHPADAPELQCSVCLDIVAAGSDVKTLPCAHTFHAGCIDTWLMRRASCPCCREPIEQA